MAKLYFRYGAMNSGKSTALMQVAHNYEEQGMRVLILKPQVDSKGGGELVSRLGVRRKADLLIRPSDDVFLAVEARPRRPPDPAGLRFVRREPVLHPCPGRAAVHGHGGPGHPGDLLRAAQRLFPSRGFPGSTRLMELAHTIEEMKTICTCGRKAICNARKVGGKFVFEGEQVAIDMENDVQYVSMCPQCYFRERRAFYAARGEK